MTRTGTPDFATPAPTVLATVRAAGQEVVQYRSGEGLDPRLSPRPHLHPVRTLAGAVVTDALPADHRWHLGVSVAVQDVGGVNVWGGRTYRRGSGYVWLDDHGWVEHESFRTQSDSGFVANLLWRGPDRQQLLRERRAVCAAALSPPGTTAGQPATAGWVLRLRFSLDNITGSRLELGSPSSNGRDGGGYGGFFWRLPPLADGEIRTGDARGEEQVHGRTASWLAVRGRTLRENRQVAVVFRPADERTREDPWFVRMATYPGIGSSLAPRHPVALGAGESLTRGFDVLIADGSPSPDELAEVLARLPSTDQAPDRCHGPSDRRGGFQ